MKTYKKILGVALALIMIFNVFAVGTFAAGTESAVDLYLATDKETYAPGDDVVITVSAQAIAAVGDLRIGGGYAIGYDSAAIQPYSTEVENLDDHGVTAIQGGYDASISVIAAPQMSSLDAEGAATYGWDSFIIYAIADDWETSFDATSKTDLFTFKMKIADDAADGTYTLGFNKDSYVKYDAYINDAIMGGIYGYADDYGYGTAANYGFNTVEIKVSSGPSVEVKHVAQQSKWKGGNANNTAENYLFGFVGQFTGIDVETKAETVNGVERQQVQNIKSIVATATINGQTVTSNVITIWAVDGGYQFRAQFAGFTPDSTLSAAVTFAVTMSDGTTVYTSAEASRVINDIYTASVANGLPAVAA